MGLRVTWNLEHLPRPGVPGQRMFKWYQQADGMNTCTDFHLNLSSSSWDISVWTWWIFRGYFSLDMVDHQTETNTSIPADHCYYG